jgi:glucosamine kinase
MIAIVDSGSTKSNWVLVDTPPNKKQYKTEGINPYYQTAPQIYTMLAGSLLPLLKEEEIPEKIYFYGAGCSLEAQQAIVAEGLQQAFPAAQIYVESDMLGAARSLFGDEEGIACIAGTGANTCHYAQGKILRNVYSPGLSLGDEGSGGFLGKLIARDYVRDALPPHLKEKFEQFTPDRLADILDKVYKKPFPNRYLASLAPFAAANQTDPYIRALVYENFDGLFKQCISRYEGYTQLPVSFIGSIAAYLKPVLEEVAAAYKVVLHKVAADPMEGLIDYYIKSKRI